MCIPLEMNPVSSCKLLVFMLPEAGTQSRASAHSLKSEGSQLKSALTGLLMQSWPVELGHMLLVSHNSPK